MNGYDAPAIEPAPADAVVIDPDTGEPLPAELLADPFVRRLRAEG